MRKRISKTGMIGLVICFLVALAVPALGRDPGLVDRRQVPELLHRKDFASLELMLTRVQEAVEKKETTEYNVRYAFWAFTNTDPLVETRLLEWIGKQPDSFAAHYALARHYLHVAAVKRGSNFRVAAPEESWEEIASYHRKVVAELQSTIKLNPRFVWSYQELFELAKESGDWDSANAIVQMGLRVNPESGTLHKCAIELLGSNEAKFKFIDEVRHRFPTDPDFRFLDGAKDRIRSQDAAESGDLDSAIRFARQAVSATDDLDMMRYLMDLYFRASKFKDVIATLDLLLIRTPNSSHAYYWRARANESMDNWTKALENYNLSLEFDSMNPASLNGRARMSLKIGRNHDALSDIEKALQFTQNDYTLHDLRSYYYTFVEPDLDEAVESFRRLTLLQPDRTRWLYMLGMVLREAGNCEAIDVLERYTEMCESGAYCGAENTGFQPLSLMKVMSLQAALRANAKCSM